MTLESFLIRYDWADHQNRSAQRRSRRYWIHLSRWKPAWVECRLFLRTCKSKRKRQNVEKICFSRSAISSYIQYSLMLPSGFNGAKYIVFLNDGNLLAEAGAFQKYSDALTCFNITVSLDSFGRWKEVYLEGYDRAGQFIDLYQFHSFSYNYWNTFSVDIVKSDHFCKVVSSCCLIFIWFGAEEITRLQG